jgi:zinc transport system substrate-binding protein
VTIALVAAACRDVASTDDGRLRVVTSVYPIAEAAASVGGDAVSVENLASPGVEPHDLELAPDDLEALLTADVVLFVGEGFQPAIQDAVGEAEGLAVDVLAGVETLRAGGAVDPHVWLDPTRFRTVVGTIARTLADRDPDHAEAYLANAERYEAELQELDDELRDGLASCERRVIVVSHDAFGYLAAAYGLEQQPIVGISPEAEPDPARLAELEGLVRTEGVTTIFTEELVSPEVAQALARETGVGTSALNPLEGLTQAQLDAGEDYGSVMRRNLEALRGALGCA